MSQHDFNIANQGFPATRADLNNALAALASNSSGTSEPSTTYAGQFWNDTTNSLLKFRNGANDGWITFAKLDQATNEWEVRSSVFQAVDSAGIAFKTDEGTTRATLGDDGNWVFTGGATFSGQSNTSDILPVSDAASDIGSAAKRYSDLYLSGGVYLGGTGSANKLDDYEEGTWTPAAGVGTITVLDTPTYTKVGRWVFLTAALNMPTQSNTSQALITGLPFTAKQNGSNSEYGASIGEHNYGSYIELSIHSDYPAIVFRPNGSSSATYSGVSGKNFRFSLAYITDQ